jgi:hypothetical protein
VTRRWRTSSSGSWVIGVPFGGRKLHQAFGSNKLQWSQIKDFIVFAFIQRRYTKSGDYSATNKMTWWLGLLCERTEDLRKGDILAVARKCREKRRRNVHDRDYRSRVRTPYLKVLYCMVSCIVSEWLWFLSLPNYAKWKAGWCWRSQRHGGFLSNNTQRTAKKRHSVPRHTALVPVLKHHHSKCVPRG